MIEPTMEFSFNSVYLLLVAVPVSTSPLAAWHLKTNTGIDIHGTGTQAYKTLYIPRGAKIDWTGTKGNQVLTVFSAYTQ
jgi:hypothetical protein